MTERWLTKIRTFCTSSFQLSHIFPHPQLSSSTVVHLLWARSRYPSQCHWLICKQSKNNHSQLVWCREVFSRPKHFFNIDPGKFNPISRLMSAMIPPEMPSLSGNTRHSTARVLRPAPRSTAIQWKNSPETVGSMMDSRYMVRLDPPNI